MGVFNKRTSAVMCVEGGKSLPIERRELRRWMERQKKSGTTAHDLVEAAGVKFGFKPTPWLFDLARDAIRRGK